MKTVATLYLFLVFLLTLQICNLQSIGLPDEEDDEAELLVDAALQMVRGFLKKNELDPMKLPDLHIRTKTKILGVNANVIFDATNLYLSGLSTLHKSHFLEVTLQPHNRVRVRGMVEVSDLAVYGNARLRVGVFGTDVASIHIQRLEVLGELELPRDESGKPEATKFEIQDIGRITIRRGQSGIINNWIDTGANLLANNFRDTMKKEIGPLILENVNKILQTL